MVFSIRDSFALIDKTPIFIALTRSSMSSKNLLVVNPPWFTTYQVKNLPLFTTLLVNSRCYALMESLRVQKLTECFYKLLLYEESPLRNLRNPVAPRLRRYLVFPTFHISYSFLISQFWYSPTYIFLHSSHSVILSSVYHIPLSTF